MSEYRPSELTRVLVRRGLGATSAIVSGRQGKMAERVQALDARSKLGKGAGSAEPPASGIKRENEPTPGASTGRVLRVVGGNNSRWIGARRRVAAPMHMRLVVDNG